MRGEFLSTAKQDGFTGGSRSTRREDSVIGPKGYDEFNQARGPGFGWPHFVGDHAYPIMDYETQVPGKRKIPKPDQPISQQHRAGRVATLAAEFCLLSYDASEAFPAMGTGGQVGYRRPDLSQSRLPQCPFAPGQPISRVSGAAELSRRAVFLISMDEEVVMNPRTPPA